MGKLISSCSGPLAAVIVVAAFSVAGPARGFAPVVTRGGPLSHGYPRAGSAGRGVPQPLAGRGVPQPLAASAWRIVKSPNPLVPNGIITGVSCSAANACEAVGSYYNGAHAYVTLAEAWNGTAWTLQPTPNPASATDDSELLGVSCSAANVCEAVGDYINKAGATVTLAEAWNGTAWKLQPTPNPTHAGVGTGASLFGTSCSAANACEAVGDFFRAGGFFTFAEAWNGTAWTLQPTPNPSGTTNSGLSGVSCSAASACEAVGSYANSAGNGVTLAEAWNGTAWTLQPTPNPSGTTNSGLSGVSCGAASACEAVGNSGAGTLAETWNGTAWTLQPTPNPAGGRGISLDGVSCSAASACEANGSYINGAGNGVTLAEAWNGTAWKLQTAPSPPGGTGIKLIGVSCSAASACEANGFYTNSAGTSVTLAEVWNGTAWKLQSAQDPAPRAKTSGLTGVSCSAASACEAIGNYMNSLGSSVGLAEAWNGSSWKLQTTAYPADATGQILLTGVSCSAASACEAVGTYPGKSFDNVTLAEAWNGTTWKLQTTPNLAGTLFGGLTGVSCSAASACEAVGDSSAGTLAEVWNGTAWKLQTTPNPAGALFSELTGVSCSAASACEAVGYYNNSAGKKVSFAEAWNGTAWKLQTIPAGATGINLTGVSCTAASACEAVGNSGAGAAAEAWNGTAWKLQPTPNPSGATSSDLLGVACTAAQACEAVGNYTTGGSELTLVLARR